MRWSSGTGWDEASLFFLQVKYLPMADNYEVDMSRGQDTGVDLVAR